MFNLKLLYLTIYFSFALTLSSSAQEDVAVVVITNQKSKILIDGIEKGEAMAGSAFRTKISVGEHYVEALTIINGVSQSKGEIVQLELGKQKILKLDFEALAEGGSTEAVPVAEINLDLPGTIDVIAWQVSNTGQEFTYPSFYYAFEKGDEIILDAYISNEKGTNVINVSTHPNGVIMYNNNSFLSLKGISIKVPERSIYRFTLATNHALTRNCYLKIKRKPISKEKAHFNSHVSFKRILTPVQVAEPQNIYINSGSNALFSGGKSRVLIPVTLPQNTIEWFYRFSAFRSTLDIEKAKSNLNLFGEISTLVLGLTGPGVSAGSLAIESLTQPPGADYCEILLLPHESGQAFEAKADDKWKYYQDGSRTNLKSGNVKVTCCLEGSYFLGIKNPDSYYGVNISVEVVAITAKHDYVMEHN